MKINSESNSKTTCSLSNPETQN